MSISQAVQEHISNVHVEGEDLTFTVQLNYKVTLFLIASGLNLLIVYAQQILDVLNVQVG